MRTWHLGAGSVEISALPKVATDAVPDFACADRTVRIASGDPDLKGRLPACISP